MWGHLGAIWLKLENKMSQVHEPSGRTANTTLETMYFFDCALLISPELSILSPFSHPFTLLFTVRKYWLNAQYMPGTALSPHNTALKKTDPVSILLRLTVCQCSSLVLSSRKSLPCVCEERPRASGLIRAHHKCGRASRRHRFDPWMGTSPWRRKWQPTPVFLPG